MQATQVTEDPESAANATDGRGCPPELAVEIVR